MVMLHCRWGRFWSEADRPLQAASANKRTDPYRGSTGSKSAAQIILALGIEHFMTIKMLSLSAETPRWPLASLAALPTDHFFRSAAHCAFTDLPFKSLSARELARLMVGMLPESQLKPLCYTIIANGLWLEALYKRADLIKNCALHGHGLAQSNIEAVRFKPGLARLISGPGSV
jgi:hypothetical protein